MTFLHPQGWLWASLAILIFLLYFIRFGGSLRQVAAFPLWRMTLQRRPAWLARRFWGSLALHLLLLLLLVAALIDPHWTSVLHSRRNLVLVIDVSASMSATDSKPNRLAHAQVEALKVVEGLRMGEELTILTAADGVQTVRRFTDNADSLREAILALQPTAESGGMPSAIETARHLLKGRPNPHLIVVTDGCCRGAEAISDAEDVRLVLVGEGGKNVGLTRLEVRSPLTQPEQRQVLVEAVNHSGEAQTCPLAITFPGFEKTLDWELSADPEPQRMFFPLESSEADLLTAELQHPDDLLADNRLEALAPARARRPLILVSSGNPALESALSGNPLYEYQRVETIPSPAPENAVWVFDEELPALPDGPVLVVHPIADSPLWKYRGRVDENCLVEKVEPGSPLLLRTDLTRVVFEEVSRLEFSQPTETVAHTRSGEPLLSTWDNGASRGWILHANLAKSDLAARRDFPQLLANALNWLAPAEPLRSRPVAAASPIESRLQPAATLETDALDTPTSPRNQPFWMSLALVVLLLSVVEWGLFQREYVI